MSVLPVPIEVFYSYADTDEDLRSELDKHLSLLRHQGLIAPWHKRLVTAGQDWAQALDHHLNTASIILLLISADFLASDYCYGTEMQRAIKRQSEGETRIIPILLRPVDWQSAPFGKYQALPSNGRPVTSWSNRDEAFADIVQGIRAAFGNSQHPTSRSVPFMVEDLPANFVQRPDAFEPLIRCLLDGKRDAPIAITAALRGAGGYGKTTLARALCHDKRVQEAFDDGILWVTFGERPGNLVNKVEELLYTLNREKPGYTSLDAATARLVELLTNRSILLVLDDVWNNAHLNPFLQGGKRCARLITTRDERVVPESVPLAQRIQVDAMRQDEAVQLLISGIQGFEEHAHLVQHRTELKRLATRLGEWPLLLMLVRSVLQERINRHMQDVAHAITIVHRALDKRGVTAFDHSNPIERSQAVAKTIEVSFELLRSEERDRYQELAIFPEDVDIPLQTLQQFWSRTGHLDEFDTEDLCIHFWNLSLLLNYNSVTQTVRLHDVIRNYLQHQCTPTELAQLHACFLDSYPVKHWADLPQNEPYMWDYLATHLIAAGRTSTLKALLTDGAYLASKAYYRPLSLLEQDLELTIQHDPDEPILHSLQHSISNMTHLIHACQSLQECACVLHSRLVHLPEYQPICQSLEHRLKRPYLTAWHILPDLPMNVLKRTLTGHTGLVSTCAISPDDTWLLSASYDQTLKIWDVASGQPRQTLTGHTDRINACAISPDGSWLLSASSDHTLMIWDVASGQPRQTLTGHTDRANACAISPDGTWLLSASSDHTLMIWDVASGQPRQTLTGHTDRVNTCAISPDGTWLLSASYDQTLRIWDATSGQPRQTLTGHTGPVNACAISPDGTWFLSASSDHTLMIWDVASGQFRHTLTGHTSSVYSCAISPDSSWLLSASYDDTLRIWDATTNQLRHILSGHASRVNACAISPDGSWLLSASNDHTLRIWDTTADQLRYTLSSHTDEVTACAIDPDGSCLLSASEDHTLKVWDVASGQCYYTFIGHTDRVNACAISPDGTWFLSASSDDTLRIWDATSRQLRYTLSGHTNSVYSCAISPDGTWLLSGSADCTLKIWDATSGQLRHTLSDHTGWVTACAISPDGTWLLSGSADRTLKIWDATSGQLRHTLSDHTGWVTACAISPDGTWLLSASNDDTLKIWDATSGQLRYTLTGHTNSVNACAISPDGTCLLSASDDHSLRVWDVVTKRCRALLRVNGALLSCLFGIDRDHVIASGEGGVYFLCIVDGI